MAIEQLEHVDKKLAQKRGEGKKYALLMAAIQLFGEYGYKGTSSRMIVKEAGANIAAIPYYYGGKEGLYHAVVAYISERVTEHAKEVSQEVIALLEQENAGKKEALEAYEMLMLGFAKMLVEEDEPKAWAQIIMREQANPTAAFDIFYNSYIKNSEDMAARCIGLYLDKSPDDDEVRIRFHTLLGQMSGFVTCRESLLRTLGVEKLTEDHIRLIHQILITHARACLDTEIQLS